MVFGYLASAADWIERKRLKIGNVTQRRTGDQLHQLHC